MGREIFEKRKLEFKNTILTLERLPEIDEIKFSDNSDQRIWFNSILRIPQYKDYVEEINTLLEKFNKRILSDEEKKQEFLNLIQVIKRIPLRNEFHFSDDFDMHTWYIKYTKENNHFVDEVKEYLPENIEFDIAEVWSDCKEEFLKIIKDKKRIPKYHEIKLSNGIDVKVIYDKLSDFEPYLYEQIKLYIARFQENALTFEERREQLINKIKETKTIPLLREYSFIDDTDMFTWYMRYQKISPELKQEVEDLLNKDKKQNDKPTPKKINIYLIPNFKTTGGKFYTICQNTGELLDISEITSYEELSKKDPTVKKTGGLIIKQDEEIESITLGGRKK